MDFGQFEKTSNYLPAFDALLQTVCHSSPLQFLLK